uniref:Putative tick ixostatin n=1 Tax=Ixodes ricinus TaxID=34613 RepID=V5GHV2_IXORI
MKLAHFIVMVTFTHLSCEVLSVSSANFYGEFESLPQECQNKLKGEMEQRCDEDSFHPQLLKVSECEFTCGGEHNNGQTILTHGRSFFLRDGTPCGQDKVCMQGICINQCSLSFVKGLKERK